MPVSRMLVTVVALLAVMSFSCKLGKKSTSSTNSSATNATEEKGVEKVKPAPGTGNVQGKVYYNSKPAPNIEVKLCETFNRFMGGCSGKTYTAKTDSEGVYVIANVPPGTYESVSYTHLRAHETPEHLVCRLLLEKKK